VNVLVPADLDNLALTRSPCSLLDASPVTGALRLRNAAWARVLVRADLGDLALV
jgi:hypothetical protein